MTKVDMKVNKKNREEVDEEEKCEENEEKKT